MSNIYLHNLKYKSGSRGHKRKTSGRGFGSGSKRAFKGNKGQGQRNTGNVRIGFEGGQTPIYRRVRKIGFNNYEFRNNYNVFTLENLVNNKKLGIKEGTVIDKKLLAPVLTNEKWPIKIISSSEIKLPKNLTFVVDKVTDGAKEEILDAKGTIKVDGERIVAAPKKTSIKPISKNKKLKAKIRKVKLSKTPVKKVKVVVDEKTKKEVLVKNVSKTSAKKEKKVSKKVVNRVKAIKKSLEFSKTKKALVEEDGIAITGFAAQHKFNPKVVPTEKITHILESNKPITRAQATVKVWDYIKEKDLQDKKNRRNINVDADGLGKFIPNKKVITMFELAKYVSKQLVPYAKIIVDDDKDTRKVVKTDEDTAQKIIEKGEQ